MNKTNLVIVAVTTLFVLAILFRQPVVAILLVFGLAIFWLHVKRSESFKNMKRKKSEDEPPSRYCPPEIDDNPMARSRMRTWKSHIPTYLYNAERGPDFVRFCYGHLKRFKQWNF